MPASPRTPPRASYAAYLLPDDLSATALEARLAARLSLEPEDGGDIQRVYLDTFDWRLHDAGGPLVAKQSDRVLGLIWEDARNGKAMASCRAARIPSRPDELPPGVLRDALAPVVEMRVLLPLARVHSRTRLLRVLDGERKTVARLRLESDSYADGEGKPSGEPTNRLTLVPVKGYARAADRVAQLLEQELGLSAGAPTRAALALERAGRTPGDYSSKLDLHLSPEQRADDALRHILRHLLDTLQANVPGARADLDSEFLHDLRVATRRTRSALAQVKDVLPATVVADFKARFGWLGQVTGPARDLDVFVLGFDDYRDSLPQELRADLAPLLPYLEQRRRTAHRDLDRKLGSPHFHRLLKDWRAYLDGPADAGGEPAPLAARTIGEVAGAQLWRTYRQVLKAGRAIGDDSPATDLHALRKRCKKLRYLLEFFASLYPRRHVKPLIKQLKRLLDNLGEFQDLEVQAHELRAFGEDLQGRGGERLPVVLAIGSLIGNLLARQAVARSAFAARFAAFDDDAQHARCRAMFKHGERPA